MAHAHSRIARCAFALALIAVVPLAPATSSVAQTEPSPSPASPAASASPSPAPSVTAPAGGPTPAPAPAASPRGEPLRELLLEAGYTIPKVYNNYASGLTGSGTSYVASGAYRLGGWAVKFDERFDRFKTVVNVPGPPGPGTGFLAPDGTYLVVPPFLGRITDSDVRLERGVFTKSLYLGLSYVGTSTSYGYPTLRGLGAGIEQYSDFKTFGFFGSFFYYPTVSGTFVQTNPTSPNFGKAYPVSFGQLKYAFEFSLPLSHDFYTYFGYGGYRMLKNTTATAQNIEGPVLGVGTRLFRGGAAADEPDAAKVVQTVPGYRGYVQGALRFGGENTVGAIPPAPEGSGSYQLSAMYRSGPWAYSFHLDNDSFSSKTDPVRPVASITEHDGLAELRALVSVTPHDVYIGLGLLQKSNNNGYSSQFGPGLGAAKLPNLTARLGYYGSIFYYAAPATLSAGGKSVSSDRRYLVYDYGATIRPLERAYVFAGYSGYHGNPGNDPIDETHSGPYVGIGFRL
jgi:hypothetical protein